MGKKQHRQTKGSRVGGQFAPMAHPDDPPLEALAIDAEDAGSCQEERSSPPKYPRTPYWPSSPAIAEDGRYHPAPELFVGVPVVVTEKIDGSNTLLHRGNVYSRSTGQPSDNKWHAMSKKWHAWKTLQDDLYVYGEDIFGVHSISYGPVRESCTFYGFAVREGETFLDWEQVRGEMQDRDIPLVPVLYEGVFGSRLEIDDFLREQHAQPSALGGDREGMVLRRADSFAAEEFQRQVCKSVRSGHVQTDEHWTRNWKACELIRA